MAEVNPPLFQNVTSVYTAADLGLPYRDLIAEGVVGAGDFEVTERDAGGPNMSVDVAAGVVWVAGDDSELQPTYRCYSDGVRNLAIAAADGSDPRIDLVIAEVRDSAFAGVSVDWRLRVVTGTPASSPAEPALPDNALRLASVAVAAASSLVADANITDMRQPASTDPNSVGEIKGFAGAVPHGWVAADGSVVKQSRYPRLYAYLGTTWDTGGEAADEFRLPDYRDRTIVGAGSTYTLGDTGGATEVTLATSEMPSHAHGAATVAAGTHSHGAATGAAGSHGHSTSRGAAGFPAGAFASAVLSTGGASFVENTAAVGDHAHAIGADGNHAHTINAEGGGSAHDNMPPYAAANIGIRA